MDATGDNLSVHSQSHAKHTENPNSDDARNSSYLSQERVPTKESQFRRKSLKIADEPKSEAQYLKRTAFLKVEDLHDKLNNEMAELDARYGHIMSRRADNFAEAYNRFMAKTQHELKEMKRRFELEDLKRQKSSHVVELQNKLKLFRDESLKLAEENYHIIKENNALKSQIMKLNHENQFLTQYIKVTAQKANKKPKPKPTNESFETPYPGTRNKSYSEVKQTPNKSFSHDRSLTRNTTPSKVFKHESSQSKDDIFWLSKADLDNQPPVERFEKLISDISQLKSCEVIIDKIEKTGRAIVHELDSKLNRMRKELEKEIKQKNALLRNKATDPLGELEVLFIECVDQVRKDIYKRKVLMQQQQLNNLKNKDPLQPVTIEAPAQNGTRNITFEEFLMKDKQKLIEMFLTNRDVLHYIYEGIFSRFLKRKVSKDPSFLSNSHRNMQPTERDISNLNLDTSKLLLMIEEDIPDDEVRITEGRDLFAMPPKINAELKNVRSKNNSFIESSRVAEKNESVVGEFHSHLTSIEIDGENYAGGTGRKRKLPKLGKIEQPKIKNYPNLRNRGAAMNGLGFVMHNK